ncbi:hypothetical protein EC968_004892 [Mortierella alpina]|nr:hypothetical protein EC968_004892 [Mortierella alpina]
MLRSLSSLVLLAVAWLSVGAQVAYALPAQASQLPAEVPNPMRDKATVVKGLNNDNCRPSPAHPRVVVLLHGTFVTEESWHRMYAPALIKLGYCVFTLTYGRQEGVPILAVVNELEGRAREVGDFINGVLKTTNTSQVDIVGYSQGAVLPRYWMKYMDGAGKVKRMVGIASITHGSTYSQLTTLAEAYGLTEPLKTAVRTWCKACIDQVHDSPFIKKLNDGGDTTPGVIHSYIGTRYDETVTPYDITFSYSPGVTNTVLQDLCSTEIREHLLIFTSKVVLRWVLNQLDPDHAKPANCISALDPY